MQDIEERAVLNSKSNMKLTLFYLIGCFCLSFHSLSFATEEPTPSIAFAGGWHSASIDNQSVVSVADFAVNQQSKVTHRGLRLAEIINANQQVVAGTNYRLVLIVLHNDQKQRITAHVWHKLDGTYELTNWIRGD